MSEVTIIALLFAAGALVLIAEHFVGFSAFLKPNLRFTFIVAVIAIRMILHRQPAIGALDLLPVRSPGYAEDFVIVSFGGGHKRVLYLGSV